MRAPPLFRRLSSLLCLFALALVACGDDDASPVDAGLRDAGEADGGADAGPPPRDAGSDGGTDAGPLPATGLCDPSAEPDPYPAPDAWGPNHGPGGPRGEAATFGEDALWENCAYLSGGETDVQHHNLVAMYDGYLVMPWAPESGGGGMTFWDFSDPCSPALRGRGTSETMRETHAMGFSHLGGSWAVVDHMDPIALTFGAGGIEFWDVSDTSAPAKVSEMDVPGFFYPDAYARVSLSVFWEVPYAYVGAADNGVYIVDATDPREPRYVGQYAFEPTLRVGQVQVIGNLLVATAAEGPRAVLLDVSDPTNPVPISGGDFVARDAEGESREAYFTNVANGFLYFARKDSGAGLMVYDIRDPSSPTRVGSIRSEGGGGYVFVKDEHAFEGAGSVAYVYDVSDPADIREVGQMNLVGDLDTATPIGNVVVLSVDADAEEERGSAVTPWQREPDTRAPRVTWSWPADGATGLATSSRVGVTFSEFVDAKSAFEGSVRLYESESGRRVLGTVSAQETIVNFHPFCPLEPGTRYTLEIPAGGVVDYVGNAIEEAFSMEFTTAE